MPFLRTWLIRVDPMGSTLLENFAELRPETHGICGTEFQIGYYG
jgi:hypothetical protein